MRITPTIITDINNRVMGINDHRQQVRDGRLVPLIDLTTGWFVGGEILKLTSSTVFSTVDRVTFTNDTTIAQVRGPLAVSTSFSGSHNNASDGWIASGSNSTKTDTIQTVNRMTFASDASIALIRGNTSLARFSCNGGGNTTDGWIVGGFITSTATSVSRIDRITFATDTNTAQVRGNLPQIRQGQGTHGNNTNLWVTGGFAQVRVSTTSRITFASDTSAAVNRGTLTVLGENTAQGNTTDAWVTSFGTGENGEVPSSRVNRITFANDTATASVRGNLAISSAAAGQIENLTDMWLGGSRITATTNLTLVSIDDIQRITFANDTVQVSVRGKTSQLVSACEGVS